jgi:hypothetical protein
MSAATSAAGYLYASGRLRGRGGREEGESDSHHDEKPRPKVHARKVRVAVYELEAPPRREKPKGVPKIEYRIRRWTPNA